jgi:hypothetical protein
MPGGPDGLAEPVWATGTALDEFTGIYLALGYPTKARPQTYTADQVDRLPVAVVGALVGAGKVPTDVRDVARQQAQNVADLRRQRALRVQAQAAAEGRVISIEQADAEAANTLLDP